MKNAVNTIIRIHEPKTEVRSFLIADIRGYTRFTQEHGDEAAARLVARLTELVRDVVSTRGGHVAGVWGDQVLVVFESARQAIRAAVELQAACAEEETTGDGTPLHIGVGVDAGEPVVRDGEYLGAALNLAARLCSLAGPREVLASEGITHLARKMEGLKYRERGLVELKGFADPIRVIEVVSHEGEPSDSRAPGVAHSVQERVEIRLPIGDYLGALPTGPLVARDEEIRRMVSHVDAVEDGRGQFFLLSGEAGVGKTRLAQELTLKVRNRGFVVATGRCSESHRSVAYYPFLEALQSAYAATPAALLPEVPRRWPYLTHLLPEAFPDADNLSLDDPQEQQRLLAEVTGALVALSEHVPVALLLDDLQWADESSLALLHHLVRNTRSDRVLLVGTYVDTGLTREHPLEHFLRDVWRESLADRVPVPRLSADGTVNMLADIIGDMRTSEEFGQLVHRRTKGNPSLIEGMVRALGGRYQLVREIGKGGMSRVFHAVDIRTGKPVAAKIMIATNETNLDGLLRFQQEGAVLSTLKHDNIVKVYGTFMEEQASCIIMELLEGRSLSQVLESDELDLARIKNVTRQVTGALACAHQHAIVHRDIKPDNIMILDDDRVKVTDFGIAHIMRASGGITRMTNKGITLGTPLYMSPEQVKGEKVDGRSDVYSLGAVMYHAVVGRPPFSGDDPMHVALKHVNDIPQAPRELNPDLPEDWEALILKALEKDPAARYQSAEAMQEAIESLGITTGQPLFTRPVPLLFEDRSAHTRLHGVPDAHDLWAKGRARERLGDLDGALEDYRAGLALAPAGELRNDLGESTVRVIRAQGIANEEAGNLERALENYRTALALAASGEARDDIVARISRLAARSKKRKLSWPSGRRGPMTVGAFALALAVISVTSLQVRGTALHRAAVPPMPHRALVKPAISPPQIARVLRHSGQVFGPLNGQLAQSIWWPQLDLRDFVSTVRIHNPAQPGWKYGFWFRNEPGAQYRVVMTSKKRYDVYLHDMNGKYEQGMRGMQKDAMSMEHRVVTGTVANLNVAPGGFNDLTLLVNGTRAVMLVNGLALPAFDVSGKMTAGDVGAMEEAGQPVRFENFTVWSLTRGTVTQKAGQSTVASNPSYTGVNFQDFVAHVRFSNPAHAAWMYGLAFRNTTMGGNYRLVLTSHKQYILYLHDMSGDNMKAHGVVARGNAPDLNVAGGGSNDVTLLVSGRTAWLSINGKAITTLDVSKKIVAGDVGVSTDPDSASRQIGYRDLAIVPVVS